MTQRMNIAVLVSGNGSNLQAILDACQVGNADLRSLRFVKVAVVISDTPNVFALERAKKAQIPAFVIERKNFLSRKDFEQAIIEKLREYNVQLICLAGFMRIIGKTLLEAFPKRILNIHPSLLPQFPGLDAAQQALDAKVALTGCTVHLVDEKMDNGPTLMQAHVPVLPNDTLASLTERIHREEHRIYPLVIEKIISGKIRLDDL